MYAIMVGGSVKEIRHILNPCVSIRLAGVCRMPHDLAFTMITMTNSRRGNVSIRWPAILQEARLTYEQRILNDLER